MVFQNGVKRRRLRGYQGFFAQTERMASYLRGRFPDRPTWIVPNSPSELFRTDASQQSIDHVDSRRVTLIYPARGYPHKNHRMIPEVTRSLKARHGITLRVLCTLRPDEVEHLGFGGIDGSGLLSGSSQCRV